MLGKKGAALVVLLFICMVLLTGQTRLHLDDLTAEFRNDFREMLYLPRRKSLKVIAAGFDAPLADALFIKSLIYYSKAMQARTDKTSRRTYTYELFDVITDLSPRFYRAYQTGALFLTSSGDLETNYNGIKLLNKGVDVFTGLEKKGERVRGDPRWMYHVLLANTYEVNIQSRLRSLGDTDGAAEARRLAAREFKLAAASPGSPAYVVAAAAGYATIKSGRGDIEDSMEVTLSVWHELYDQAVARGDKEVRPGLEERIKDMEDRLTDVRNTKLLETILSEAGKKYLAADGGPPLGVADLLREKLIQGRPKTPMGDEDQWLAQPDGTFRSKLLSKLESQRHQELIQDAIIDYRRANGNKPPPTLQTLVSTGLLDTIPTPPMAASGQVYKYNPEYGFVDNVMPYGPDLPPDRR